MRTELIALIDEMNDILWKYVNKKTEKLSADASVRLSDITIQGSRYRYAGSKEEQENLTMKRCENFGLLIDKLAALKANSPKHKDREEDIYLLSNIQAALFETNIKNRKLTFDHGQKQTNFITIWTHSRYKPVSQAVLETCQSLLSKFCKKHNINTTEQFSKIQDLKDDVPADYNQGFCVMI